MDFGAGHGEDFQVEAGVANETVERVAAAIWKAWRGANELGGAWPDVSRQSRAIGIAMARAAMTAMREPTEAMVLAAITSYGDNQTDADIWRAMVDAALEDDPPAPRAA